MPACHSRDLTALGPAYIKFGRSCRRGRMWSVDELAVQLRVLQDKLPPFSIERRPRQEVEKRTGPADGYEIFSEFSEPVAAASIAQVHKARLRSNGEDSVPVKVLRPGIEKAFNKDVDAFYLAARIVDTVCPWRAAAAPGGSDRTL